MFTRTGHDKKFCRAAQICGGQRRPRLAGLAGPVENSNPPGGAQESPHHARHPGAYHDFARKSREVRRRKKCLVKRNRFTPSIDDSWKARKERSILRFQEGGPEKEGIRKKGADSLERTWAFLSAAATSDQRKSWPE